MNRKIAVTFCLILVTLAIAGGIWIHSARSLDINEINVSDESQAIKETILRSRRIDLEAAFSLDASMLSTVYVNDPRGGILNQESVSYIQDVRQDSTLRANELGKLDLMEAVVEKRKNEYNAYIAELRGKQEVGTLTDDEILILEMETNGWPTPESEDPNLAIKATQACEQLIAEVAAYQETEANREVNEKNAYPDPDTTTRNFEVAAYPSPEITIPTPGPEICPTPKPELYPRVPYRGMNPATLPPESFEIDVYSIKIEGDIAKATVHKSGVTSEIVLVKIDGQWYIAGAKLLKSVAP